jgi:outer membrane protein assembly factor BamB
MSEEHEPARAGRRPISRWAFPGIVLLLVAGVAGYVALLNRQVRSGDVLWRYEGTGAVRVVSAGERFLVVEDHPDAVVLDRSDGTKLMELDHDERGFALGNAVLASGETGYRLLSASGEVLWSEPARPGTSVAPVAVDVEAGRVVLLEQRDEGPDLLRGIDLERGDELWRAVIDQYGNNPFGDRDLQQVERVRLLPVQLPGDESLTVLSLDGEQLHTGLDVSSSPFVPNNGHTLVVDDQGCGDISVVTATEQRKVAWGGAAPGECHVVSVGDEHAFLLTGPWESDGSARLLALDLESGEPTGLDVRGPRAALRAAVDMEEISRGPGPAVVVPDGDEYRLYDVRTGEQTWSDRRPGRWAYDAGPAGAVLVTEPSDWIQALTPTDGDSVRHELMDSEGEVSGVVYEVDADTWSGTNLVLDQGQAAVTFGRDLVMLQRD